METTKSALVELHNESFETQIVSSFQRQGYAVTLANSVDEMLTHMRVDTSKKFRFMPTNRFGKYFMELNLGSPESPSCEPAKLIYRYVRPYKIKGEADFLGVAGYPETLECGKRARIPCADRSDISRIIEFIETS